MNTLTKLALIAAAFPTLALARPTPAAQKPLGPIPADPTKYDCRVTVEVRTVTNEKGRKVTLWERRECPHQDKMAAGQCETSWLWGMRCKN